MTQSIDEYSRQQVQNIDKDLFEVFLKTGTSEMNYKGESRSLQIANQNNNRRNKLSHEHLKLNIFIKIFIIIS